MAGRSCGMTLRWSLREKWRFWKNSSVINLASYCLIADRSLYYAYFCSSPVERYGDRGEQEPNAELVR